MNELKWLVSGHSVDPYLGGHRNCKGAFHGDRESDCGGAVCDTHADVSLLAVAEHEPPANIGQPDAGIGAVRGFPFPGVRNSHRDAVELALDVQVHETPASPRGYAVFDGILDQGLNRQNWNRSRQCVSVDLQLAPKFRAKAQLLDL